MPFNSYRLRVCFNGFNAGRARLVRKSILNSIKRKPGPVFLPPNNNVDNPPKSNTHGGTGRNHGPGKLPQSACYAAASDAHSRLTVRETEVIRYLAKGFLYKEIADKMDITFSTVHKLQHKIFVKLHVGNRTEAINKWNGGMRT